MLNAPMNTFSRIVIATLLPCVLWAQNLTPVDGNNWGLKIVIFDVGQGDGVVVLTSDGQAVLVDMGETKKHGEAIADFLLDGTKNGVGRIDTVEYLFASHYDSDHIGGARGL